MIFSKIGRTVRNPKPARKDPALLGLYRPPAGFDPRTVFLRTDHPEFLPTALLSASTASLLGLGLPLFDLLVDASLQLFAKLGPGQHPIKRLGSFPLAAHLGSRGFVSEPDARAGFLDLLAAPARPDDETFLHIGLIEAERRKTFVESRVHPKTIGHRIHGDKPEATEG